MAARATPSSGFVGRLLDVPRPYAPLAPARRTRRARGHPDTPERIAARLAAIDRPLRWGRPQEDDWDARSRFIYRCRAAPAVVERAGAVAARDRLDAEAFVAYALRRWFCFWGARMAEMLFLAHPGVAAGPPRHLEIDFTIDGVPFDLKTTERPALFAATPDRLLGDATALAAWLYREQSRQGRFHVANRIFLVLDDEAHPAEAWRLRADPAALRAAIDGFMADRRYLRLTVQDLSGRPRPVLAAIVPIRPVARPRQARMVLRAPPGAPPSLFC